MFFKRAKSVVKQVSIKSEKGGIDRSLTFDHKNHVDSLEQYSDCRLEKGRRKL